MTGERRGSTSRPHTLAEAVAMILATFGEERFTRWADQPIGGALADAHFDLGLWIRNHWVLGAGSPLAGRIREDVYSIHDDDISALILEALWRVLHGERCPTAEEMIESRHPGATGGG